MAYALIPPNGTRQRIFAAYEAARKDYEPVGINVGELGHECDRYLWLSLRRVSPPEVIEGRKLSIFDTGNYWEERIIADLASVGVVVTGQQERVRFVGGHVRGKIDGEALNVPEAPKTLHVLECKSSNEKGFKELQKKALREGKPLHYGQCQMYMHGRGLTRCAYVCVNKNDDDRYVERVRYDVDYCLRMLARAERIIRADDPPSRCNDKPTLPPCIWCKHKAVCFEDAWPRKNCRTCLHSSPIVGGENADWNCALHCKPLTLDEQAAGCGSHLYLPGLVPGTQTDSGDDWVSYTLRNGEVWVNGPIA